jgi:type 1 glutamine amidotransferase
MTRTLRWLVVLVVAALPLLASTAGEKKVLRVCLISGSAEYESDKSLAAFQHHLEKNFAVRCTRAFAKGDTELPGLENLEQSDVAILYTRRLKLKGDELQRIKNYCQSGKPLVALRTASHAVQSWLDLDREVLGGNYKGHYNVGPVAAIQIVDKAKAYPILRGVPPFRSQGSLYKNPDIAKDVEVLLTGTIPGYTEPVAWTRLHKGGRVFYTSLGHQKDFEEPAFVTMLTNAVFWAAHREP